MNSLGFFLALKLIFTTLIYFMCDVSVSVCMCAPVHMHVCVDIGLCVRMKLRGQFEGVCSLLLEFWR